MKVHGLLLLDKPRGLSSNTALQKARRLLDADKAGHGGTLDPMADGLLPLMFGEACKLAESALEGDKAYDATVRLGQVTTTDDTEGEIVSTAPVAFTDADLEAVLARFRGRIVQVPPVYSALKVAGSILAESKLPRREAVLISDFQRGGWQLSDLRAFDLYPHTHHMETVGLLIPGA